MEIRTARTAHVLEGQRSFYQDFSRKKRRVSIDSYLLINLVNKSH